MCLIILKTETEKSVKVKTLLNASRRNQDGLGVIWLDDYSFGYYKSEECFVLDTERSFIAIFRKASSGDNLPINNQPVAIDEHRYLFMNGTIGFLAKEGKSDAVVIASYLTHYKKDSEIKEVLSYFPTARFAVVDTKLKTWKCYNRGWVESKNVVYSNAIDLVNPYNY